MPLCPLLALVLVAAPPPPAFDPSFPATFAQTKGFSRGRPSQVQIAPDGAVFFLESGPRSSGLGLYQLDPTTGAGQVVVTPAELLAGKAEVISAAEQARRERARQTEQGFTDYALSRDGQRVLLPLSGKVFVLERSGHKIDRVYTGDDPAIDPQLSPAGDRVAYVRSNDLFVAEVATGKETRLTRGGTDDLTHGLAEFVAQEELGRSHGFWWAPDGKRLLYAEVDQHEVEHFVISDPSRPEQVGNRFAYPRAGKKNASVRVGLVAATGGATWWVHWDASALPYLTRVLWPAGRALPLLEVRARDQRDLVLLTIDDALQTHPLLREHDDAWIEASECPRGVGQCGAFALGDGRVVRIAATAEGDALQLVDGAGKAKLLLTAASGVRDVLAVDARFAYVVASPDPTDSVLWRVGLDGALPVRLTPAGEVGEHTFAFTEGAPLLADTFTDATHTARTRLFAMDGSARGALPSQAEEPTVLPRVEFTTVTAGANTFHALLLRPHNFDRRKHYPVIDSVYGGPTANVVERAAAGLLVDQWYADHGFIVVRIDNRGTPRRDRTWARAIRGDFATVPITDQADALLALGQKFPELDLKRVGINGWSYGGYMSALGVLARPDIFACAVAGAPVVDWTDYDTAYTERYIQTPEQNPQGYARSSLLTYATKLTRPLLIVHGTADDNVYFFNSLKLLDALFQNEQQVEFLPLIGQTHILSSMAARERLYRRTIAFLQQHLGGPK
jgi:dipeptidyl-peptidase-4